LLHTLVLEPHATWPPPTQFALHMLSAGRSDPNLEVSKCCRSAENTNLYADKKKYI
jgi:hypothetical protein